MDKFTVHIGTALPLRRSNVDTDQIIPAVYLKRVTRTGFEDGLFSAWRTSEPDFVLNQPQYRGASVLVAGPDFGTGSSREHAPWALLDYGFRAIIAPSFADIFANNCMKNGIVPVVLSESEVEELLRRAGDGQRYQVTVDLERRMVEDDRGFSVSFVLDDFSRHCLLEGLDDIALTQQYEPQIVAYEARRAAWRE